MIRNCIAGALLVLGVVCFVIAVVGVYRFDYVLNRMHAAAIIDTLGTLLVCAGLIVLRGFAWASVKIVLIVLFQWLTSPVSTHRIGHVEILTNPDYDRHLEVK
jgi:multicomponent Na+:H+ antiporter subunit G